MNVMKHKKWMVLGALLLLALLVIVAPAASARGRRGGRVSPGGGNTSPGFVDPAPSNGGVLVTVKVLDSGGVGVPGATIRYGSGSSYGSSYFCNPTPTSGECTKSLAPGTYSFQAKYRNGHNEVLNFVVSSTNDTVTFNTVNVTHDLKPCVGAPIAGGTVRYGAGTSYGTSHWPGGATDASGQTSAELLTGTYSFEMQLNGTTQVQSSVSIPAGGATVNWQSSTVTLHYSGSGIAYGGSTGDSAHFSSPMEMMPGDTTWFNFRGGPAGVPHNKRVQLTFQPCSDERTVSVLYLTDHSGAALAGGTARVQRGSIAFVPGQTGDHAAGTLLDIQSGQPAQLSYEMKYNGTTQWQGPQDPTTNSFFLFQTRLLTLRLEDCGGTGHDGGQPSWGTSTGGDNSHASWFPVNPGILTGATATGEASAEVFPGTYDFDMAYLGTNEKKLGEVVPDADHTITWQTSNLTLYYSGSISYGGPGGDSKWFTKPSMDLLPGTYKFHFRGCGVTDLTVSGCSQEQAAACLKLNDHNGSPLAGGTARGGFGSSYVGWHVPGSTDASGVLIDLHDVSSPPGDMSYEMRYNNTTAHKTQDVSANSIFEFQTDLATLRLETCGGAPLDGGHVIYKSGSHTYHFPGGDTGSSGTPGETYAEFFPGTYDFEMQWKGASNTQTGVVIPDDSPVVFQTTNVTLSHSGPIRYKIGGYWYHFAKPSMELLPESYLFEFSGNESPLDVSGCSMSKVAVTLKLKDHNGNPLAGGTARGGFGPSYEGWHVPGSTDANGVLIDLHDVSSAPGDMSYEMRYNGTTEHKTQDVSVNSIFEFDTNLLTLRLETCGGTLLDGGIPSWGSSTGGDDSHNRWFPVNPGLQTGASAPGEVAAEAFPGTYDFDMAYQGTNEKKLGEVVPDADHTITWQTSTVVLHYSGPEIAYGGATGDSAFFNSPMELMPGGTTWFNFRGGPGGVPWDKRTQLTIQPCNDERTVSVLYLKDHAGAPLDGGTARVQRTWISFVPGQTGDNGPGTLLDIQPGQPATLSYEMSFNGTTQWQGPQDPTANSFFLFQTRLLTLRLETCGGTPLDGGIPSWGTSTGGDNSHHRWFPVDPGIQTGATAPGEASAESFPGTYDFDMAYQGTNEKKLGEVMPDADHTITWKTTKVTLNYPDAISYGGPTGDYYWFVKPSMELLPGTYKFHFHNGGGTHDLTISGCEMGGNIVIVKLHNDGDPLDPPDYYLQCKVVGNLNNGDLIFTDESKLKCRAHAGSISGPWFFWNTAGSILDYEYATVHVTLYNDADNDGIHDHDKLGTGYDVQVDKLDRFETCQTFHVPTDKQIKYRLRKGSIKGPWQFTTFGPGKTEWELEFATVEVTLYNDEEVLTGPDYQVQIDNVGTYETGGIFHVPPDVDIKYRLRTGDIKGPWQWHPFPAGDTEWKLEFATVEVTLYNGMLKLDGPDYQVQVVDVGTFGTGEVFHVPPGVDIKYRLRTGDIKGPWQWHPFPAGDTEWKLEFATVKVALHNAGVPLTGPGYLVEIDDLDSFETGEVFHVPPDVDIKYRLVAGAIEGPWQWHPFPAGDTEWKLEFATVKVTLHNDNVVLDGPDYQVEIDGVGILTTGDIFHVPPDVDIKYRLIAGFIVGPWQWHPFPAGDTDWWVEFATVHVTLHNDGDVLAGGGNTGPSPYQVEIEGVGTFTTCDTFHVPPGVDIKYRLVAKDIKGPWLHKTFEPGYLDWWLEFATVHVTLYNDEVVLNGPDYRVQVKDVGTFQTSETFHVPPGTDIQYRLRTGAIMGPVQTTQFQEGYTDWRLEFATVHVTLPEGSGPPGNTGSGGCQVQIEDLGIYVTGDTFHVPPNTDIRYRLICDGDVGPWQTRQFPPGDTDWDLRPD